VTKTTLHILVALYLLLWSGVARAQTPEKEVSYAKLKSYIQEAVKADPIRGALHVQVENGKLRYSPQELGIRIPVGVSGALRFGTLAQFKAELLRPHAGNDPTALKAVAQLEDYANKMLTQGVVKDAPGLPTRVMLRLQVKALEAIAATKNATNGIEAIRDDQVIPGVVHLVNVSFNIKPPNGSVYYLTDLEHHMLSKFGMEKDLSGWYQAPRGGLSLYGVYHFAGKWGDTVTMSGKVMITEKTTIAITKE